MSDCTVEINGELYTKQKAMSGDIFIVRTYSAGVFMGEIVKRDGQEVEMKNARRLWKWSGAASLSQLAMDGVKDHDNCKFPCRVDSVVLLNAVEILKCSKKSVKSIEGVKVWEM